MSLAANEFLDRLEQQALLAPGVIASLRKQVAAKPTSTAEQLAAFLVQKGQLTTFQAKGILAQKATTGAAASKPAATADDDLGLAPIDDGPVSAPPSPKPPVPKAEIPAKPATKPAAKKPASPAPMDDDFGLAPLEEIPVKPTAATAKPSPPPTTTDKLTAPKQPTPAAKPAASKVAPATTAKANSAPQSTSVPASPVIHGLTPLDGAEELSGLEELSELTELDEASGLAPIEGMAPDPLGSAAAQASLGRVMLRPRKTSLWNRLTCNQRGKASLFSPAGCIGFSLLSLVVAYFVAHPGNPEKLFSQAEELYTQKAYDRASPLYDRVATNFVGHDRASVARLRGAIARIQVAAGKGSKLPAVEVARSELEQLQTEPGLTEVREELLPVLIDLAAAVASEAKAAGDSPSTLGEFADRAEDVLELLANSGFVPPAMREANHVRIDEVERDLLRLQHDTAEAAELAAATKAIEAAVTAGKPLEAQEARRLLLRRFPRLAEAKGLREWMSKSASGLVSQVKVQEESLAAETKADEIASKAANWTAPNGEAAAILKGRYYFIPLDEELHAFKAETGLALWRLSLPGLSTEAPLPLESPEGEDVLVLSNDGKLLTRLKGESGAIRWRLKFPSRATTPISVGERLYLATEDGRVWQIDAKTGTSARNALLPQPLRVSPLVDRSHKWLYQVADQGYLYILSLETLQCADALYTGHAIGSVTRPPVVWREYLGLVSTTGRASRLHVYTVSIEGNKLAPLASPMLLPARVVSGLTAVGPGIVALGELGQMTMVVADRDDPKAVVTRTADLPATRTNSALDFVASAGDDRICVAFNDWLRYSLSGKTGTIQAPPRSGGPPSGRTMVAAPLVVGDIGVGCWRSDDGETTSVTAERLAAAKKGESAVIWETHLFAKAQPTSAAPEVPRNTPKTSSQEDQNESHPLSPAEKPGDPAATLER